MIIWKNLPLTLNLITFMINRPSAKHKKIIAISLILICLVSLAWFFSNIRRSYKSGTLQTEYRINHGHPIHLPTNLNPNSINNWMTFDYLNVVFKLPPDYLKNNLKINDPRYPNISLNHYIRENNFNSSIFLHNIQNLIINYPSLK